jgi:MoaA/NifB/PqqE/SkfB family radical SAM enzyme
MNNRSFTSADVDIPVKLLQTDYVNKFNNNVFEPIHIQIYPTNACNLSCEFCSCANREKADQIDFEKLESFVKHWKPDSATISGGGEPLLYKDFSDMVEMLKLNNVSMGMATNGYMLKNYDWAIFDNFEWVRISLSKISLDNGLIDIVKPYIENASKCDWAFSYVCSPDNNLNEKVIKEYYNVFKDKITHMRVVGDILVADDRVDRLKLKFDDSYDKIIWQGRNSFGRGDKNCLLSKIKPVLSPDNKVYACCGAQYAIKGKEFSLPDELCLGHIDDRKIFKKTLDGSICDKCYYNGYNSFLNLFGELKHKRFV